MSSMSYLNNEKKTKSFQSLCDLSSTDCYLCYTNTTKHICTKSTIFN